MPSNNIDNLLKKLGISSSNRNIYLQAMTHSSYINECHQHDDTKKNYERLEILGDAITSKIVIEYFYKTYPNFNEVEINDAKKIVVQGHTMFKASEELGLINYARLGKGIDLEKGTKNIKEDLFESLIGAVYLDQGEKKCFEIINKTLIKYYINKELKENIDYKTKIQEIFQSAEYQKGNKKNKIIYRVIEASNDLYKIELIFNEAKYGTGQGRSKKEAEQEAAREAFKKLALN